jgi:hypothetical protein
MVTVSGFKKKYLLIAFCLFLVEISIAAFIHDKFIRPYVGDFLVVIMIYCFLKGFWKAPVWVVALSVVLFSFAIETLQYFKFINYLGLQNSKPAAIILGKSFHWLDLLAYILGIVLVFCFEKMRANKLSSPIIVFSGK